METRKADSRCPICGEDADVLRQVFFGFKDDWASHFAACASCLIAVGLLREFEDAVPAFVGPVHADALRLVLIEALRGLYVSRKLERKLTTGDGIPIATGGHLKGVVLKPATEPEGDE